MKNKPITRVHQKKKFCRGKKCSYFILIRKLFCSNLEGKEKLNFAVKKKVQTLQKDSCQFFFQSSNVKLQKKNLCLDATKQKQKLPCG